jgi:hypothetical protein
MNEQGVSLCTTSRIDVHKSCRVYPFLPMLNLLLFRLYSCAGCAQLLHQKWSFSACGPALNTPLCSCSRRYCVPCVPLSWTCSVKWVCSCSGFTLPGAGELFEWCHRLTVSLSGKLLQLMWRIAKSASFLCVVL